MTESVGRKSAARSSAMMASSILSAGEIQVAEVEEGLRGVGVFFGGALQDLDGAPRVAFGAIDRRGLQQVLVARFGFEAAFEGFEGRVTEPGGVQQLAEAERSRPSRRASEGRANSLRYRTSR